MIGTRWVLVGLMALSAGCSSDAATPSGGAGASGVTGGAGSGAGSARSGAGSAGSGAGSAGSPASGLGTVGTGSVVCVRAAGGSCPAGSVCCVRFPDAEDTCESSYAACTNGRPLGCDDPSDCAGQKCCAKKGSGTTYNGSGCKSACDSTTDRTICATSADCGPAGACMQSATSFMACF
ncbi:MAG: hypothetical protein ABUL62_26125 [Myxococcales bacterium]